MKHKWSKMTLSFTAIDPNDLGDVQQLSDAELKIELEKKGYQFQKNTKLPKIIFINK